MTDRLESARQTTRIGGRKNVSGGILWRAPSECFVLVLVAHSCAAAELGPAPQLLGLEKGSISLPPAKGPAVRIAVNSLDRAAVVDFYQTVYQPALSVSTGWDGNVSNCVAGANSQAYKDATLSRVNYFRAMAGLPGDVTFDDTKNAKCQQAALMMLAQGSLSHNPTPDWACYTADGAEAADHSNLYLGAAGPAAVDGYFDDYGPENSFVGHRRWILYPPAVSMGSGSIPPVDPRRPAGANALWVLGDFGPRPAQPAWVSWPPPGYIPYSVLPSASQRWSFAYAGADFSHASVVIEQSGTNSTQALETQLNNAGYADNTLVWRMPGVATSRPEADLSYSVTVSNVFVSGAPRFFNYNVTIIDPYPYLPYNFTTLAGSGPGSADGPGSVALFAFPAGLAVDRGGNLYVADAENQTIRKIGPDGQVNTLAGLAGNVGSTDGPGSSARFAFPEGVAVDASGNLYVAEFGNHTIRRITPAGLVSTLAGLAGSAGNTDATGSAARFNQPAGVAVDNNGNVYVADSGNSTIRKVTSGGQVSTLAGLAKAIGSTDGAGSLARFSNPAAVAVDNVGNVYVADSGNNTIRKISPAGVVSTLAGLGGSAGSLDGAGSNARFNYPQGLALDGAGNVYVADSANSIIRMVTPAGLVSTLAGLAKNPGSVDGTGIKARFYFPRGLAVDSVGNVYVADPGTGVDKISRGFLLKYEIRLLALQVLGGNQSRLTLDAAGISRQSLAVESTVSLGTPINWSAEAGALITTNTEGHFEILLTSHGGTRFYRVRTIP